MAQENPGRNAAPSSTARLLTLFSIVVVISSLYLARDVLIPLALAFLFSFLLAPGVRILERFKLSRGPAVVIVVIFAFAVVGVLGWLMVHQAKGLATELPQYRGNIQAKFQLLRSKFGFLGKVREFQQQLAQPDTAPSAAHAATTLPAAAPSAPEPTGISAIENFLGPLLSPLATAGVVIIFVIFMLIDREDLRDRTIRLMGKGRITLTTQAMDDAGTRVSRYLLMQSIMNSVFAVFVGVGLWMIGIPNPALWGLLAGICRFVPYIGPFIGASMPFALAMAVSPASNWTQPLAVLGWFVVLEITVSQFLEPYLYGSSTGISALAILVAAVFWTWLWGPIGLLLSTPLTVCLVVMGKYVPQLEFLNILLGSEPVLEPPARLYQRLLAGDQEEAADLMDEFLKEMTPLELYDKVMLPALAMTEDAHRHERLDDAGRQAVLTGMLQLVQDAADRRVQEVAKASAAEAKATAADAKAEAKAAAAGTTDTNAIAKPSTAFSPVMTALGNRKVRILCLPAHDEADELAAEMLAQALRFDGSEAQSITQHALAGEMMDKLEEIQADVVCIASVPPDAVIYARYLSKRIRQRFSGKLQLVVGIFTSKSDPEKLRGRLRMSDDDHLVVTLAEAVDQVRQLSHEVELQK